MKTRTRTSQAAPMTHDAYAGFLKLWLTPAGAVPKPSPELDAYLRHANEQAPLSDELCAVLNPPVKRAA
jgi:hypothetical protein